MPEKLQLETQRLLIRTYESQDAPDLHQFVRDNTYYLYDTAPMTLRNNISVARSLDFIDTLERERIVGKWLWNAIFKKDTQTFIGQISIYHLSPDHQHGELGYFITADEMSKGFGTEAVRAIVDYCFTVLSLRKIILRIKPDNLASQRIAQKLHFQKTGLQTRSFKTYHGDLIDQEVFELVRGD